MVAFNKLFLMLPVMLAARKLDSEDPNVVYWVRIAYFSMQTIVVLLVAYTYIQATAVASKPGNDKVVYVPPVPTPFADPNAKKKYTQVVYSKHIATTARGLLASTLFGIVLTAGLHFYKGMIVGLAIQAIMSPFTLIDNALFKALVWEGGLKDGAFDEKTAAQLTDDDEVVDDAGNAIVVSRTTEAIDTTAKKSFEEVLLDTWDEGTKADLEPLLKLITKTNCNYATKENKWTPLMVLCGLGAKGTAAAIRQVKEIGGDPFQVDVEGWNALHWAAFHGSLEAAKALEEDVDKLALVKDKEGNTPLDHAKAEGNDDVAKFLEEFLSSTMETENTDGMRKRK